MKKLLSAVLALTLCLSLCPALAAETPTFTDVANDDWFASYVDVCVEEGLMNGVGGGRFAPEKTLSNIECSVLALRLHDLAHDGDGTFAPAPAEWGYAALHCPDGTIREGYVNDRTIWAWHRYSLVGSYFGFSLDTDEARAWGLTMDYQRALLTLNGVDYPCQLHLSWGGDAPNFLYLDLDGDNYNTLYDARLTLTPTPQDWWRDAWYYAQEAGLDTTIYGDNEPSSRLNFAKQLAAVTDLPAINEISGLPDDSDPGALKLYRAGVLTGVDPYGTFEGSKTLTRAEAAAICARALRPELRLAFTPRPLETYENYTLTYLREDGPREYGPYRPMQSEDLLVVDDYTLLRLDGVEFAAPENYQFVSVGDGLAGLMYFDQGIYFDSTRCGLMDSQGQFWEATHHEAYSLPSYPNTEELHNGYRGSPYSTSIFYNAQGDQVAPAFSWHGVINGQGQGFVGLDGKIYRIEFAPTE